MRHCQNRFARSSILSAKSSIQTCAIQDGIRNSKTVGNTVYHFDTLSGKVMHQTGASRELWFIYDEKGQPYLLISKEGSDVQVYWYLLNAFGDVIGLLNSTQQIVATYRYDPYGRIIDEWISSNDDIGTINPLRYRGYYYDSETGFYYLQSRYYDPEIGRFISNDSFATTDSHDLLSSNMFAYCLNDPVNKADTGGTIPEWAVKMLVGTAVIAAAGVFTFATAGTGVACFAVGALQGSFTGALTGAVSGALIGVAANRITTGSWQGSASAALNGAASGYMSGAITGFILGGITSDACFVAGTAVLTADGLTAIENIEPEDYVWAWDEETGDTGLRKVKETYVNKTEELVHIFVNDEEIITTPNHPFWHPHKGWTEAIDLRAGDILVLVNGEYVIVEKIQHEILERPLEVYNFQVEEDHTYYVSDISVLVHNACKGRLGKQAKLREIAEDDKVPSHIRGEIKRDLNMIARGKRPTIRVPSGYELSHMNGFPARLGFGYEYSRLDTIAGHRLHHKVFKFIFKY